MFDPWIPIGLVAIIIIGVAAGACIAIKGRECRNRENQIRQEEYSRLLSAITRVHLAGDEEPALAQTRLALADQVHRMNLTAGYEVLVHLNALLELQNRTAGGERNPAKEHAVLQKLVRAMRREMKTGDIKRFDREKFAFKFYLPAPVRQDEPGKERTL
jgi:hypothetical protein